MNSQKAASDCQLFDARLFLPAAGYATFQSASIANQMGYQFSNDLQRSRSKMQNFFATLAIAVTIMQKLGLHTLMTAEFLL